MWLLLPLQLLYFDAVSGRLLKGSCRDTAWATFSSTLGFPVMGIWPPDSDGTDINSLDRSPQGDLLLTADDSGKVRVGVLLQQVEKTSPSQEKILIIHVEILI
jgi:hypothetical protein